MITTEHELTLAMAKAFAVYMIAGGLSGIISQKSWIAILDEIEGRAAVPFVTGVFVYVLGVVIIIAHNYWTDILAGFISLIGWVAAIEGLIMIVMPSALLGLARAVAQPLILKMFAIGTTAGGVLLLLAAMTASAP